MSECGSAWLIADQYARNVGTLSAHVVILSRVIDELVARGVAVDDHHLSSLRRAKQDAERCCRPISAQLEDAV